MVRTVLRKSVEKWPESGATRSTRGCGVSTSFLKCRNGPNGGGHAGWLWARTSRVAAGHTSHPEAGRGMGAVKSGRKNYGSWSLRGWLLCKMAGLEFEEQQAPSDDPSTRAELLLLSPSFLVPCLTHDGVKVWDTLAIAEYVNELKPDARLIPAERVARARCRAISGEMHSGFSNLRSALPMNLKAHYPGFKVWPV